MKWQYKAIRLKAKGSILNRKFVESDLEETLNNLGQQGWELVLAIPTKTLGEVPYEVVAILKCRV